jgi:hypothetical protein
MADDIAGFVENDQSLVLVHDPRGQLFRRDHPDRPLLEPPRPGAGADG